MPSKSWQLPTLDQDALHKIALECGSALRELEPLTRREPMLMSEANSRAQAATIALLHVQQALAQVLDRPRRGAHPTARAMSDYETALLGLNQAPLVDYIRQHHGLPKRA